MARVGYLVGFSFGVLALACGDDAGTGTTGAGGSGDPNQVLCDGFCNPEVTCPNDDLQQCLEFCMEEVGEADASGCRTQYEAIVACAEATGYECGDDGYRKLPDGACDAEEQQYSLCRTQ